MFQAGRWIGLSVVALLCSCSGSNKPPEISAGSLLIDEDQAGTISLTVSDPEGKPIVLSLVAPPAKGTATITAQAPFVVSYVPLPDANGSDSFDVKATDEKGATSTAHIVVAITPLPDPVRLSAQSFTLDEDTPFDGRIMAIDPDGDTITCSVTNAPAHGALSAFNPATGGFRYTPASNFHGPDGFDARCTDGTTTPASALMTLAIQPANDPPIATADTFITPAGTSVIDVLANDSDVDGDALTIGIVSAPAGINATSQGTSIRLDPQPDIVGRTQLTYRITDAAGTTALAEVQLVIGSAPALFYTSAEGPSSPPRLYRYDMFSPQLIETPLSQGERINGFVTAANGSRLIYVTRTDGSPFRYRLWLKDLVNMQAPAQEIPTPGSFFAYYYAISPDGRHAIVNNEYLFLEDLSQRQFFDSSVERPRITRNSAYVYYAKTLGSAQRVVMRAALQANGFIGSPAQMSTLRNTNEGLGIDLGLSPDESLITTQALLMEPSLTGPRAHAFVTRADGLQNDQQLSSGYTQSVDYAYRPDVTPDGQYAYFAATIGGTSGIFARLLGGSSTFRVDAAPAGMYVPPAQVAADSRTLFYSQATTIGPPVTNWFRVRLDQPGNATPFAPAGTSPAQVKLGPDGRTMVIQSGANLYVAAGSFDTVHTLPTASGSTANRQIYYAGDSRAVAISGADPERILITNPLIPGWSTVLQQTDGNFPVCIAWAGSRC